MAKNTVISPEKKAPQEETSPIAVGVSQTAEQNTPRNIGLIIAYEYKKRLSQRSFKITTAIILILILLGSFVPTIVAYVSSQINSQTKVVVVNTAGPIAGMNNGALLTYIDRTLNATTQGQTTSGKPAFSITMGEASVSGSVQKQVKDGKVNILLVLERAPNQDVQFTYTTNANPMSDSNVTKVQGLAGQLSLLDRASRLGLTTDQTSHMFAQPQFSVVNLGAQNDRSTSDIVAGYVIAYVGIMLIFMSIYLYGYGVAMGVAEEKGSRIMEILVNAATPFQLMAGKILGIGAAGLTQMTAFVVVGIGALLLQTPIKDALCHGSVSEAAGGGAECGTNPHVAVLDWVPGQHLWSGESQCDVGDGDVICSVLDTHDDADAGCHGQRDMVGSCSQYRVDGDCYCHLHRDRSPYLPLWCADVWPEARDASIDEAGPHEMRKHA
jgi:ABC-2 type transport system permease protein